MKNPEALKCSGNAKLSALPGNTFLTTWLLVLFGMVAVIPIIGVSSPALLVFSAIILVLVTATIAGMRMSAWGFADPLFIFAVIFCMYNGSMLLEYGLKLSHSTEVLSNGMFRDSHYYENAAIGVSLAACGLYLGALFLRRTKSLISGNHCEKDFDLIVGKRLFWIGLSLSVSAILVTVVAIELSVGMGAYLSATRIGENRINPSIVLGIGIPLWPMGIAGVAAMAASLRIAPDWVRKGILVTLLLFWTGFEFLQGNRHLIIYLWAIYFLADLAKVGFQWRKMGKYVLIGFMGYMLLAFVSSARSMLPAYFTGTRTIADVADSVSDYSWTILLPSRNEFNGPFHSLTETINKPSSWRLGGTYWGAALSVLPSKMYPGEKPDGLAVDFAKQVWLENPDKEGVGYGYSPVAEAYTNYSFIGIPVIFFLMALLWHWVGSLRFRGVNGMLFYLILVPQCLNGNRYSTDAVFQEAVFALVLTVFVLFLSRYRSQ